MVKTGGDDPLAQDIVHIEQIVMLLLGGKCRRLGFLCQKRLGGLGVDLSGWDGNQFPFRVAQGSQLPAEDAAGINIDGSVQPFGSGTGVWP